MSNPFLCQIKIRVYLGNIPVPDPDHELKKGPVIQTPQIRGEPSLQKKFLFGLKIRWGQTPRAPSLDPPLHPSRPPGSGYACH